MISLVRARMAHVLAATVMLVGLVAACGQRSADGAPHLTVHETAGESTQQSDAGTSDKAAEDIDCKDVGSVTKTDITLEVDLDRGSGLRRGDDVGNLHFAIGNDGACVKPGLHEDLRDDRVEVGIVRCKPEPKDECEVEDRDGRTSATEFGGDRVTLTGHRGSCYAAYVTVSRVIDGVLTVIATGQTAGLSDRGVLVPHCDL